MRVHVCRIALVLTLCAGPTLAADNDTEGRKPVGTVPQTSQAIEVDGNLDDAAWGSALALELPFETNPGENTPAPVETVCMLTNDDARLYVGCRASDPDPTKIRARLTDRDSAFQDDFVGIVIDTFNDERRAFEFFVNPMGVQMDLIQDDVNGSEDSSWDAIWDSAGQITEQGYEVEMAIPFSSLSFQRADGAPQTWGLDIVRIYPRDRRMQLRLNKLLREVDCYLCQASTITGFAGAEPGKNLEITPTLTAGRTDEAPTYGDSLDSGDTDSEVGLTARWGFTNNLTLLGTVNPDFSQVEADAARLSVNEPFALFFREKRPFFLEGQDFFDTPISAVYTRTVEQPDWAAKITGKEGRNAIGSFFAQDKVDSLIVPGSEGSSFVEFDEQDYIGGVMRYRRDVGQNSAVGALVTAREGDDYYNRVAGIDAQWRFNKNKDTIRFQALGSQTEYPDDSGLTQEKLEDLALEFRYFHDTRNYNAYLTYLDYGEDFRADMGFVTQVDYSKVIAGGNYRWWGDSDRWYSRIGAGGDWDETRNQEGDLIERELEGYWDFSGAKQSYFSISGGRRERVFNTVEFDQNFNNIYFEMTPVGDFNFWLFARRNDRIDFGYDQSESTIPDPPAAQQGIEMTYEAGMRYNFGRHLKLSLDHTFRNLTVEEDHRQAVVDENRIFKANVSEMNLVYQFNVRAFLRLITQYVTIDELLFNDPADPPADGSTTRLRKDLFNQFLFSYKVNPRTVVFVGYTDNQANNALPSQDPLENSSLEQAERSFFVKLGYAWVP
ncbi:MAG: carbohydrate binding family 9 domain-containing protein [bacterium]|nr:carbohydrate binding family 9 domain-containing protein [bacterium]